MRAEAEIGRLAKRLPGRRALVTGAASGLGRAFVLSRGPDIEPVVVFMALAGMVGAALAEFVESEVDSVRMEGAERALDLGSPKSELEAFVRGARR